MTDYKARYLFSEMRHDVSQVISSVAALSQLIRIIKSNPEITDEDIQATLQDVLSVNYLRAEDVDMAKVNEVLNLFK